MFVNVRAATDEDIAIMLRDGKAFTCCREKDGAGCSECSAAFKFDDWFIRRLIARVQEEQLSQMQDRATLAAIRDRLRHILANIHSPGPTAAALRRIADDLDALIGGE